MESSEKSDAENIRNVMVHAGTTSKEKILYLIDTLEIGGAERSLLAILSRMRRFEPIICHLFPGENLKAEYERANIRVISLNLKGKYPLLKSLKEVQRIIRELKPSLVHSTLFRSDIAGRLVCTFCEIPLINSLVNDSYVASRYQELSIFNRIKLFFVQSLDRITSGFVHRFVSNSLAIARSNSQALRIPSDKIRVIYRGRSPENFCAVSPIARSQIRNRLNINPNEFLLINVARLLARKGHEELLKAMILLTKAHPNAKLLIAGDGPNKSNLERIIQREKIENTSLLGTRNDVPELLQAADAFVFPSHYEGLPGALVEAMFTGLPVIASDIDVHKELITDRQNGLLFKLKDPYALASAISEAILDVQLAQQIASNAKSFAVRNFDIQRIVDQYESLYAELLSVETTDYPGVSKGDHA